MSRTRTLTNLIADVRQRTNMENSEFVSDAEITEYLNQELAELHGRLTAAESQPHFRTFTDFSVVIGTNLYALPADFWKVQRCTTTIDGCTYDLEPFMEGERAGLYTSQNYVQTRGPMYRIQAGNIEVVPVNRAFTLRMFYVSAHQRLVAGSDTTDGFNGYEVAAIYGACATILQKEESDPSFYLLQKQSIYRHIDSLAAQRDASHPERVTDVTGGLWLGVIGQDWWV
jgi:hypothetical protein